MAQTCSHLDQVDEGATPSSTGCEDCLRIGARWVHLRMLDGVPTHSHP
jgi:hypothetical protein